MRNVWQINTWISFWFNIVQIFKCGQISNKWPAFIWCQYLCKSSTNIRMRSKKFFDQSIKMWFPKLILIFAAISYQDDSDCIRSRYSYIRIFDRELEGCWPITETFDVKGCKLKFYEIGRTNRRMGGVIQSCSRKLMKEIVWEECTEAKLRLRFNIKWNEQMIGWKSLTLSFSEF